MSYNTNTYNTVPYNANALNPPISAQDSIVFNGFSFQDDCVYTERVLNSTPRRDVDINEIPRNDGEFIVGDFYRRKVITLTGIIKTTSNSLLEAKIDEMKKLTSEREGNLDIKIDGVIRRFKATLINGAQMFEDREHYHIVWAPFTVQFMSVEPFGHPTTFQSDEFLGTTDLNLDLEVFNAGTIHATPEIILNFTAVSGITEVQVTNNTNGQIIKASSLSLSVADILKFDGNERLVTLNGSQIDYSGFFPRLEIGANSLTIDLTGTSATYDLTIKHLTPFL
jgi:hypothetical protein